jgi:hypothetical protein
MEGLDLQSLVRQTVAEYIAQELADKMSAPLLSHRVKLLEGRLAELARLASQTERGL